MSTAVAPQTKKGGRDLKFAEQKVEEARAALDQALSGYGVRHRFDNGAIALRAAFHKADEAVAEIRKDREVNPDA